jgi:hypothetical protein
MDNEETYVNIQTSANPDGKIRAEVKVSGSNATETGSMNEYATADVEDE